MAAALAKRTTIAVAATYTNTTTSWSASYATYTHTTTSWSVEIVRKLAVVVVVRKLAVAMQSVIPTYMTWRLPTGYDCSYRSILNFIGVRLLIRTKKNLMKGFVVIAQVSTMNSVTSK